LPPALPLYFDGEELEAEEFKPAFQTLTLECGAQRIELPRELLEIDLHDVLNAELWNSLTQAERDSLTVRFIFFFASPRVAHMLSTEHCKQFLVPGDAQRIFTENFHFGNPVEQLQKRLKGFPLVFASRLRAIRSNGHTCIQSACVHIAAGVDAVGTAHYRRAYLDLLKQQHNHSLSIYNDKFIASVLKFK
jgi:hypothetical protein